VGVFGGRRHSYTRILLGPCHATNLDFEGKNPIARWVSREMRLNLAWEMGRILH